MVAPVSGVRLYGGLARYFNCQDKEVLLEGGVRTGKSNAVMWKARIGCETFPGLKVLFTRETRKALSTTILPDFEQYVLGQGHAAIVGTAQTENRHAYRFPNGSIINLIGMDDPGKVMSGQWDWICYFQAERGTVKSWRQLITRLSGRNGPYRQITGDCNPAERRNWANVRGNQWICRHCGETSDEKGDCTSCKKPMAKAMRRIGTRQEDNPLLFDHHVCRDCRRMSDRTVSSCYWCGSKAVGDWTEFGRDYMSGLQMLTGVDRDRYLNHKWVSAEGLIFTEYDHARHHVHLSLDEPVDWHRRVEINGRWVLDFDDYFATFDWGYVDPACLCIWGVIGQQLYRIWEGYFPGKQMDWWIDKISEVDLELGGLDSIVCDARPEFVDKLNERLMDTSAMYHVRAPALVTPFKGKDVGIDSVKRHLAPHHGGQPDLYLCYDAHRWGLDKTRTSAMLPRCMEDEFETFSWMDPEKRVIDRDRPEPDQEDHAMDNVQFACLWHEHVGADDWARPLEHPDLGADILGVRETLLRYSR